MRNTTILLAACGATFVAAAAVTADFSQATAKFRPALHSSGYSPNFERTHSAHWDEQIKEMNFDYVRTHDLGLINCGCRAFDVQYMFPLMHLDPADPKNYFFATTDFMVDLQHAIGQKTFFRLGTSIEHTGLVHFAAEIPKDFDKMAEVFAGTVRHYVKGWGDPQGKVRLIDYWEIWNEPDGSNNMWSFNGGVNDRDPKNNRNAERRELFVKFFVKVLKRLKSEFPDVKVKMCKEEGFDGLEFIINEWHFICKAGWGKNAKFRAPDNMNDINSACYTLTVLSRLQTSRYDQAYIYGCRFYGNWGFYNYETRELNKTFYALKAFGEIKKGSADICASASTEKDVTAFATKSADGKKAFLLVTDYYGRGTQIPVAVKGLKGVKKVSARVLSFEKDLEPFPVKMKDGKFTLSKPDAYSAAFLVTFDL